MNDYDSNYLVGPHGEDDILYTAIYSNLTKNLQLKEQYTPGMAYIAINSILQKGELPVGWSFDMHYGLISLSHQYLMRYEDRLWWKQFHYLLVPRDLILFTYVSGDWAKIIAFPFLWIWSIWIILGALITTYKIINGQQVLATDGLLITWLVLNTFKFPITKKIVDYIVRKKYVCYANLASIYYGNEHPITKLMTRFNI